MTPTHDPRLLDRPQSTSPDFTLDELDSASRNHSFYLEMLALDETPIGAHYVVLHFDIPLVDAATWRLEIDGLVARPISLSFDDVKRRPASTRPVTLECAGNGRILMSPRAVTMPWRVEGVSTASWTGTSLRDLLLEAGIDTARGKNVVFRGRDRGVTKGIDHYYERALSLDEALRPELMLAYAMNGAPLPPQHGYPLRLVVPGWYGMTSVKWIDRITVIDREFEGYQQKYTYRYTSSANDLGEPVTRMNVRSLFAPPGIPDGDSRKRTAEPGAHAIVGKAWSGTAPVARVEFSSDGGASWHDAELDPPPAPFAWQTWRVTWRAEPGAHMLCSRATDATGAVQPVEALWNLQGMGNNSVHRLNVTVAASSEDSRTLP
jgi:DMSO/TMAO reductase YedYZ molybdopterin-dependent catalytic subunit